MKLYQPCVLCVEELFDNVVVKSSKIVFKTREEAEAHMDEFIGRVIHSTAESTFHRVSKIVDKTINELEVVE